MSYEPDHLAGDYTGTTGGILALSLKTTLLTIVTLGIYRFWAKTRLRRYIWSATAPGGDAFEYTGTGMEKLLGFLIAIVILATVLGVMQIVLFFIGLSFFNYAEDQMAQVYQIVTFEASLLVIVPLMMVARYRARRYMLSRTRWRGIRFGMDKAAIGYMLRAIGHSILTMITLGILLPRQTYYLTKYMTDRTWYGDQQFELEGRWEALWRAMLHVAVGLFLIVAAVAALVPAAMHAPLDPATGKPDIPTATVVTAAALGILGYLWLIVGFVHYRVKAFSLLTGMTRLGQDVTFRATPSTGAILGKVIGGSLLVGLVTALALAALVAVLVGASASGGQGGAGVAVVVGYLVVIAFAGALTMAFVVQPVIRHIVVSTMVTTPAGLARARQRPQDDFADADGFADALDVGAAI